MPVDEGAVARRANAALNTTEHRQAAQVGGKQAHLIVPKRGPVLCCDGEADSGDGHSVFGGRACNGQLSHAQGRVRVDAGLGHPARRVDSSLKRSYTSIQFTFNYRKI